MKTEKTPTMAMTAEATTTSNSTNFRVTTKRARQPRRSR
jgi:hypothetical protein